MPSHTSYQYQQPEKPTNWPKIILIVLGILMLIITAYFAIKFIVKRSDSNVVPPTQTYDCSSDVYNCDDFTIQAEAQAVFDYCSGQGAGDVHGLDADRNGEACESLP